MIKIVFLCAIAIASALASGYDKPAPYAFGYETADHYGSHSRQEAGDAYGNKKGSYTLTGADGRVRRVNYVADDYGFRAEVKTNEPGTNGKDSADAVVNGPDGYGYGSAHQTVAHAGSYAANSYAAAPAYGHARSYGHSRSYGYAAPSYGHSRSYGYSAPARGYGHALHGSGYGRGYSRSYSYAAPSYGHGNGYGYGHGAGSYGHGAGSYGHGVGSYGYASAAPSYGYAAAAPSYGYSRSYNYAAPAYGRGYGARSYGYGHGGAY